MQRLVVASDDDRQKRFTALGRMPDEGIAEIASSGRLASRVVDFAYVLDPDTKHGSDVSAVYLTADSLVPGDVAACLRPDTVRHPFVPQPEG